MNDQQEVLRDTVDRLFAELAASRPEGGTGEFQQRWASFEEIGLQGLLVPEDGGGFGGGGVERWLVCHAAGRHAVDLPVVEAILAAGLLSAAGLEVPPGVLSIVPHVDGSLEGMTFTGSARRVPWGRHADHVVGLIDTDDGVRLLCIDTADAAIEHRENAAGEPRDDIRVERASVMVAVHDGIEMLRHGALARAAQMAGASRSAMDLAIAHVIDRSQFGRPLAGFQAVQHNLATLAEQVSAAEAASRAACIAGGGVFEVASAKVVANLASEAAVAITHQMHGAIGFTWEYALHRYTRRLIAWRAEFGNTRRWSDALGRLTAQQGADEYWAFLVAGSPCED